jgi:hypothetical protein
MLLKTFICAVHCLYSEWGNWSPCSVTCGTSPGDGSRERKRYVGRKAEHGGLVCEGSTADATTCVLCEQKEKTDYKSYAPKKGNGVYGGGKACISPCPSRI